MPETVPFINLKPYIELVRRAGPTNFEDDLVTEILASHDFIGGGPTTQRFEAALAKKLDVNHAIACANGTDALQLALRACGIERGHRVAIPNLTFWATFEAVVNVGATPVLLDINPTDLQLDIGEFLRAHQARHFDAVVLVHLFGWCSAKLAEFRGVCRDKRITLIEDGAQAFGVQFEGQSIFADADVATLSFYPAKVLGGIGDGGAVLTRSDRIAKRARALANHGRTGHYDYAVVGWNSRMDAIQAAWLLRALEVSDKVIEGRRAVLAELTKSGGVGCDLGNAYLDVRQIDNPKAVAAKLRELGVEARHIYPRTISDAARHRRHRDPGRGARREQELLRAGHQPAAVVRDDGRAGGALRDRVRGGDSVSDERLEVLMTLCACCGHREDEHDRGDCWGTPLDPQATAGDDECPCNGFVARVEEPS